VKPIRALPARAAEGGPYLVRRRQHRFAILVSLSLLLTALVPGTTAGGGAPTLTSALVQGGTNKGLNFPWDLGFTPDGRMIVNMRGGQIRVYANGNTGAPLVSTFSVPGVRAQGEAGLMGIAIDPEFVHNHYIYVCASRSVGGAWLNQVLRYVVGNDSSFHFNRYIVSSGMVANTIHNGCAVEFIGGKLWVTMGDAGVESRAQNRNSLNGKILRMERDGSVPSDNPVINGTRNIVYTMGHRNPQGLAILPGIGRIYAIEHGPDRDDEINRILPGRNYGWPCRTGNNRPYHTAGCASSGYTGSAWASGNSTIATSGGTFMTGTAWGSFSGNLWVSQLKEADVRRFVEVAPGDMDQAAVYFNNSFGRIRAAVRGPYGRLYITTSNGGGDDRIIWIAPKS
jgi:glucose/arabinose dehydrogenase